MAVPPKRRRWADPAAEAALVLVVIGLLFVAALAGFVVGESADDSPAAAQTVTTESKPATTEAATTESTATESNEADGAAVFANAGCGSCHTFSKASSSGQVGPPLDDVKLNKNEIEERVRNGRGGMPAFGDRLSDAEIEAVAEYVASG